MRRGAAALEHLLATRVFDLRELDVAGFRAWLERHLTRWREDPAFVQRCRLRDLRRAHPELQALEEERAGARAAYEASAGHPALEAARRELAGAEKAVAGIAWAEARARAAGDPAEAERLRLKLADFEEGARALRARVAALTAASPERRALEAVAERLARRRAELGFDAEVAELGRLQRLGGRSSVRSGSAFERAALEAVRAHVLPELEAPEAPGSGTPAEPVVLTGATLGAARTELDQLVVRPPAVSGEPAEVLAVVEAKRNPNDLAHGVLRRLENLSWLAGHGPGYDPAAYRTEASPNGHFEGAAVHRERGAEYRFTRASFARFLPDLAAGVPPGALYLVTQERTLWGIGSAGLARVAHRLASEVEWAPEDDAYLAGLLAWAQGLTHALEAPDVLRRYAAGEDSARRVLLLGE